MAELRQVFLFIYFMLSLDTWHLLDTPMQLSSIDVHMLWYVLQFLFSPWAVYLPPGSSLHLHWWLRSMRCTDHSVTRLHRTARDSPLQLMGSPGAQPMHWQPEFPLSGSLPSILLPQACPATALTHAHNRSLPKPQPYSPRVFQAVQWSNTTLSFTQPWWSYLHWETACSALACWSTKSNGWVPPSATAATCVSPANPCLHCVEHPQPWACTVCRTRSNCSHLVPTRYVCLVWYARVSHLQPKPAQ